MARNTTYALLCFPSVLSVFGCSGLDTRVIRYPNSISRYPAADGAVLSNTRDASETKIICVLPPPAAAMNTTFKLEPSAGWQPPQGTKVDVKVSVENNRTLAKVYELNERTLLLQFALYRLCEAYANGLIGDELESVALAREMSELQAEINAIADADKAAEKEQTEIEGKIKESEEKQKELKELKELKEKLKDIKQAKTIRENRKTILTNTRDAVNDKFQRIYGQEQTLLTQLGRPGITELERNEIIQRLRLLKRRDYWRGFERVLATSVQLADVEKEMEKAKAEAEKAKYEAEKAKAEAEKAKADAEKAKAEAEKAKNGSPKE